MSFSRHIWRYSLLALGFFLKEIGAFFDVSYHFKHLREFYQIPHLINGAGNILIVFMLWYLWIKEPKVAHERLKILLYGLLVFAFGIIFDQYWHQRFGVDLTIWSPTHLTLYLGSLIALVGAILYVSRDYKHGHIPEHIKNLYCLFFFVSLLSGLWFPLLQQEHGVIAQYYLMQGAPLQDSALFSAFFAAHKDFYADIPAWIYSAWGALTLTFVFHLVKSLRLHPFAPTIIASFYIAYRSFMNIFFLAIHYPISTIPYHILMTAFLFDLIYSALSKEPAIRDLCSSAMIVAGVISIGFLHTSFPINPPIPLLETFLIAIPLAILGYFFAGLSYKALFHKHI